MCLARRVLAVDDDPKIRLLLKAVLEDEGYDVRLAEHGAAALEQLQPAPCLIILDLLMPVLDGRGFVQAYRRQAAHPADIVVTTAEAGGEAVAAQLDADFLRKPFDLDELVDLVEQHVQAHTV
jgi:two-component system chemotaxis response regulator CheY